MLTVWYKTSSAIKLSIGQTGKQERENRDIDQVDGVEDERRKREASRRANRQTKDSVWKVGGDQRMAPRQRKQRVVEG